MSSQPLVRILTALTGANVLLSGAVFYNTNSKLERNYEETEARMDEVEGTLRGHIGLIEESLERIEEMSSKAAGKESGWGKGMGKKTEELYSQRGKDDRKK